MRKYPRKLLVAILFLACTLGAYLVTLNTTAQAPPVPGSATFRYDSLGRIVQDSYPANSAAYSYDAVGNRTAFTLN